MRLKVCENCIYLLTAHGGTLTACGSPLNELPDIKRQPDAPCNQWEFYDWELRNEWKASDRPEDIEAFKATTTAGGELRHWEDVERKLGL